MCCVFRLTCYVLCFARYVNVISRSNTRARMVVTQHISISSHTIQPESTLGNREAMASSLSAYCYPMFELTYQFSSKLYVAKLIFLQIFY